MKKNIIKSTMIAIVAIFAGYNVYQSNEKTEEMSEIMIANVEALADGENSSTIKVCPIKGGTCTVQIGDQMIIAAIGWQNL